MAYRQAVRVIVVVLLVIGLCGMFRASWAGDSDKPWVSRIVSVQGRVLVKRLGEADWRPARLDDTLSAGDQVRVEVNSRAGVVLSNDAVIRLDQNTTLVFTEVEQPTSFVLKLLKGAAQFFSRQPRHLEVVTPFVNGVVEGTEFLVQVDEQQSRIDLFEGRVRAFNQWGELQLTKGQSATATTQQAPRSEILARPRDSVQWALYYPPILAAGTSKGQDQLEGAMALSGRGQAVEALSVMDGIPESRRDSRYYAFRAALLLNVGRVAKAREDIRQALSLDGANSDAMALSAVIAVVQNQKQEALAAAQEAVRLDPKSATALIALSYAYQAVYDLPQALKVAQEAVTQDPENAIAWARLAELRLSTGELDQGVRDARRSTELNPDLAHAHTILGFAYLTQIKTQKAREAFNKAIALDSAAPLPRLGLGLATIRDGHLEEGRAQIEIAAGLDPDNALIRSYLGKAYFEEKREPLDERQFEIAKTLDPNDPTPWFYDAIRKQTLNRPVEALQDLQKSIELNDNRAVYRSRLMLDEDLAARSASLGRIYNDLDFQHLALTEGYKSLGTDSTNYSAHRLLGDTYAAKPRHEIARVSELLQAQLFEPLSLTPVLPRLAESDSSFLEGTGPLDLSFYEFNPMFTRNRIALQATGIAGNNETWGDEITGSGVYDKVSASLGSFHYQTEGFRENNDYDKDIFDGFVQASLTHRTNLQAEYRYSEIEKGDRSQNFDGQFSNVFHEREVVKKLRFGGHHIFSERLETVASVVFTDTKINQRDLFGGIPGSSQINDRKRDGYLIELRGDYKTKPFAIITGIGHLDENLKDTTNADLGPPFFIPVPFPAEDASTVRSNIYAYSHFKPFSLVELTLGLSADWLERGDQIDTKQLNPKFGLLWQASSQSTIRLAAFRVLSSTNVSSQTIEPTQVSGFNQFFDDINGSKVWHCGAAVSHEFTNRIFGGIELSKRFLDVPEYRRSAVSAVYFSWEEYLSLAYLYWIPYDNLALSAEYQYEHFDREDNPMGLGIAKVTTHRFPLRLKLFYPWGLSWGLGATYFLQDGDFQSSTSGGIFHGSDNFWVVDTEISYRLPKRFGVLSVGVNNLLDEEFSYQNTDPSNPTVIPAISIYGKLTISF